MRLASVVLACCFLPGCSYLVYKMDVQQGNYVTQDVVARVKPGMTKAEVRQVLGTPLLSDVFHGNRWDYYFSSEKKGRLKDRTLLSVFFENDKVVSVKGEARPPAPPPVGQSTPDSARQPPPAGAGPSSGPTTATVPVPGQ